MGQVDESWYPNETTDETPPGFHLRWNMFFIWDQTFLVSFEKTSKTNHACLRPRALICFSVFGTRSEALALVFDILPHVPYLKLRYVPHKLRKRNTTKWNPKRRMTGIYITDNAHFKWSVRGADTLRIFSERTLFHQRSQHKRGAQFAIQFTKHKIKRTTTSFSERYTAISFFFLICFVCFYLLYLFICIYLFLSSFFFVFVINSLPNL